MGQYKKEINSLRESVDQGEATKLSLMYRHVDPANVNNMSTRPQNQLTRGSTSRTNIVIKGLKGEAESDILAEFLSLSRELNVIVYKTDVDEIFRMKRRNDKIKMPGPVLVKLNRTCIRDSIMKNKSKLKTSEARSDVYINPDELLETRRMKAIFRRVASKAKEYGEEVELGYDCVWIAGRKYTHDELHSIPKKFLHDQKTDEPDSDVDKDKGEATASTWKTPSRPMVNMDRSIEDLTADLIQPGEKMRMTKYGLLFSGPTAYPSNLFKTPIQFQKKDYTLNEQAVQCTKATRHDKNEIAETLKQMTSSYEIKIEGGKIVTSEEWNEQAPNLLWGMLDLKMKRNPELLARLIKTAPLPLIEAGTSTNWGGAPLSTRDFMTMENSREEMSLVTSRRTTEITK